MSTKLTQSASSKCNNIKKRQALTLQLKYDIVKDSEEGMKTSVITKKFNLPYSTVRTIIKDKQKILDAVKNAQSLNSRIIRKRHGIIADMETLLKEWCEVQVNVNNFRIHQKSICNKAKQIFNKLKKEARDESKTENFVASNGWYSRFKRRCDWYNLSESKGTTNEDEDAEYVLSDSLPINTTTTQHGEYCVEPVLIKSETELVLKEFETELVFKKEKEDVEEMALQEQNFLQDPLIEVEISRASEKSKPEPLDQTVAIEKLAEAVNLIKRGIRIFEEIDPNEERAVTTRRNIQQSMACYEEIIREKRKQLSCHTLDDSYSTKPTSSKN